MSDKPILKIPVDTEEWDQFVDSFANYQKLLETQGDAWAGSNKGIRQQKTAFDEVDKSFSDLVSKATDNKFSGPGGAFVKVQKNSKETEKSWRNIAKDLEKSAKSMGGLARNGLSFSGVGGLLGVGGLAAAGMGVFNAVRSADNSLADQNLLGRKLGLAPGEEGAFTNVYEKAGGDDALLHKVASVKSDQSQWRSFMALGISQNQIQSMDPAHLAAEVLKRGGEQFNARGASTGLWASATGVSSLIDVNSMRLAGSYQGKFDGMGKQFEDLIPKLAASQKALDDATMARQKIEAALAKDELELYQALEKLNPLVIKGADAVTDWITAFAKTEDFDKDVQEVSTAFTELGTAANWVSGKLNALFGGPDSDPKKDSTVTVDKDGLLANLVAAWQHPKDFLNGKVNGEGFSWDYGSAAHKLVSGKDGNSGAGDGPVNNPGNLRVPGSTTQFQHFDNADQGALAMDRQLQLYAQRDRLSTLQAIIGKYAPSSENDTAAYVRDVAGRTGFESDKPLDMNDPAIRAAVEAAMIHHEGTPYARQFDRQHIQDLLTGKTMPDDPTTPQKSAFEKHARADDPMRSMQILPYTDDDARAIAEGSKSDSQVVSESITDRLVRGLSVIGNSLREGGGAFARGDDTTSKRIDRQGNILNSVNVTVSTPAGNNTTITASTLSQ
ncbi:hypothetical protein [Burkholderia sp. S171]|uniref:hypothetical protein n=1 Tax=Burkholderia sp. S171 TaxID=1641860 RepID=UPI00131AA5EF|nr:hypothetical protein [Burkholderia sp. S171]